MADRIDQTEYALDQQGSADENTIRHGYIFSLLILVVGLGIVFFGELPLPQLPEFSTFYGTFVFVVDAITAVLLLGQFQYRRRSIYAALATGYLFKALIMLPFLLTVPGAIKDFGPMIGDDQSAAWIWTAWHLLFPAMVGAAVLIHHRGGDAPIPASRIAVIRNRAIGTALALVVGVTIMVTLFHEQLATITAPAPNGELRPLFFVLGSVALAISGSGAWLCWQEGRRKKRTLHLWLAITLLAFVVDILARFSTTNRYSVGWYFGRVEAMIAASVLLLVLMHELNGLYHRLAAMMDALLMSNKRLATLLQEKEALVTNLQHSEKQIRLLAYYDSLTELPNRRLLLDRLGQALNQAQRYHRSMAVMFLDLDHFKEINDTLGHDAGDKLLIEVARRITTCLRRGDTASRSGGDEFIIVISEISQPADAAQVAEKVLSALREPVDLDGHITPISTSIGIAIFPVDSHDDLRDLMQKADKAMYVAKAEGRNRFRFYSAELDAAASQPSGTV